MRRRGVPAVLLSLVALAGCTKPTPSVTVQSGATVLRSEAIQYIENGKTVGNPAGPKVLDVRAGDYVNVDVDGTTAQAGWVVLIGKQKISPIFTHDEHHFSFIVPTFEGGTEAPLAVFQQPPDGGKAQGAWLFTLRQQF